MIHEIRGAYVDEDVEKHEAVVIEVPDVIWLQVANYDESGEVAAKEDWTFHDERVMESDVAYVPLARAETAENTVSLLTAELHDALAELEDLKEVLAAGADRAGGDAGGVGGGGGEEVITNYE